jgi:hypothetical protein
MKKLLLLVICLLYIIPAFTQSQPQGTDKDDLTEKVAFLYYVNGASSSDEFIEEYLFRYMNDIYTQTKNDEFEYRKSLNIAKEQLIQNLEQVDSSKKFNTVVQLTLGNYDFERKGFPIQEDSPAYIVVPRGEYEMFKYFNLISLAFSNFTSFQFFKISEDDASQLIKRRKDNFGNINREVYAVINFKITQSLELARSNDQRQLVGEITSVELYEYKHLNVLIGIME